MIGIVNDIKMLFKKLKNYRVEHNQSFWGIKRIFNVLLNTLKKTWVLIILGGLVFFSTAILAIINAVGEILYFSLVIIYIFVSYVVINVTILVFKYINKQYYDDLNINKKIVKRISKVGALLVSIIIVVGLGFTQIYFVNHYINAPIAGYSYYDGYGNLLYEQSVNNHLPNGEKGFYKFISAKISRYDDESLLSEIELFFVYEDLYKKEIKVSYENARIKQIVETDQCYSNNIDNWYFGGRGFMPTNDDILEGHYNIKYTIRETIISYQYEVDTYTQEEEVNYYIYGNTEDKKLLHSTTEEQVFKKVQNDSQAEIIIDRDSNSRKLYGDKTLIVDLYKKGIIYNLRYELADKYKEYTDDEIFERATKLINYEDKNDSEYDFSMFYDENKNLILQYYNNKIQFSTYNDRKIVNDSYSEFASNENFIQSKTYYKNNYLSTEFKQLVYEKDDLRKYDYQYKHIYDGEGIKRIDQYKIDNTTHKLVNRYLFKEKKYGYLVTHYSYYRNQYYKFTEIKSNQLPNCYGYNIWVPMTLQRSTEHFTNELVYQELPYIYLIDNEEN